MGPGIVLKLVWGHSRSISVVQFTHAVFVTMIALGSRTVRQCKSTTSGKIKQASSHPVPHKAQQEQNCGRHDLAL